MLQPTWIAKRVIDISDDFLLEHGISTVFLDLDNTLVEHGRRAIDPRIISWINHLQAHNLTVCILSNTVHNKRLKEIAHYLQVHHVRCGFFPWQSKPSLAAFQQALAFAKASANHSIIIGDQLLTDVVGGNRAGLMTILVEPLSRVDHIATSLIRRPRERRLLNHLQTQKLLRQVPK